VPDSARILVRRVRGGMRDLLRRYRIEIDGQKAGTVARGDTAGSTDESTPTAEEQGPAPRPPLIGLLGAPLAFFGIFLVSYGVHGLIHHDRSYSWIAALGGAVLFVAPLVLARWARRRLSARQQ
jgi:hypothetical protein